MHEKIYFWLFIVIVSTASHAQVYPSAGTAWVLPGYQQAAEDEQYQTHFSTPQAVSRWEDQHADISVGGHYKDHTPKQITPIGYMYNQKLEWQMGEKELLIRQWMAAANQDYESLFLHYQEDTELRIPMNDHSSATPLKGMPELLAIFDHDAQKIKPLPRNKRPLEYQHKAVQVNNTTTLYLLSSERIDGVTLQLQHDGLNADNIEVSYALGANKWQPFNTDNSKASTPSMPPITSTPSISAINSEHQSTKAQIRWQYPDHWPRINLAEYTLPKPFSIRSNVAKSSEINKAGKVHYFAIKISFQNLQKPNTLLNVNLPSWYQFKAWYQFKDSSVVIPGWDPINDKDNNGYVDDNEFSARQNPKASARFQYQSRLVPLGKMWSRYSSFCFTNIFLEQNRQILIRYLQYRWQQDNVKGAYNDSIYHVPQSGHVTTLKGGMIRELQTTVDKLGNLYWQQLALLHSQLAAQLPSAWIGANISDLNLFSTDALKPINDGFNFFVREDYITPAIGLAGKRGLLTRWENFALAANNKKSILMAHMRKGGMVRWQGATKPHWQQDQTTNLALFYLLNVPKQTFYQQWNQSFHYGSQNTDLTNFYQQGVPKNLAYQPTAMLQHDLGKPISMPAQYKQLNYLDKNGNVIASTIDNSVTVNHVPTSLIPSHWFYLWQQHSHLASVLGEPTPNSAVVARFYEHGLILYFTDKYGNNSLFTQQKTPVLTLPNAYQRILPNGTLEAASQHIQLRGYEAAILVKEK